MGLYPGGVLFESEPGECYAGYPLSFEENAVIRPILGVRQGQLAQPPGFGGGGKHTHLIKIRKNVGT